MPRLADPAISRAVLIGTARYDRLPDLPSVAGNLDGLAAALSDEVLWGLPPENCRILLDPVTPREVDIALSEAAGAVRAGGLLLVYFAGHGLIDAESRELFLALSDTVTAAVHATAVPYDWVRRNVRRSAADRRVVILDCCYAGRAEMAEPNRSRQLAEQARIEKSCLLVAAAGQRDRARTGRRDVHRLHRRADLAARHRPARRATAAGHEDDLGGRARPAGGRRPPAAGDPRPQLRRRHPAGAQRRPALARPQRPRARGAART